VPTFYCSTLQIGDIWMSSKLFMLWLIAIIYYRDSAFRHQNNKLHMIGNKVKNDTYLSHLVGDSLAASPSLIIL
jgi:hypothetical protein